MCFCQFGSAQFSLSNRAFTGALTAAASPWPSAVVDSLAGAGVAPVLGEALGDGLADGLALADELGEPDALGVGVGDGTGVAVVVFDAASSAWRNRSSAVVPTSWTTCCDWLPCTATVMMSVPCCATDAPLKPAPLTRLSMIERAVAMSAADGVALWVVTAFSVTVVPLERSRPSCTLKFWCQLAGWNASLPTIATSMMTMSARSAAMARPGLDFTALGGATSRLSFDRSGQRGCYGLRSVESQSSAGASPTPGSGCGGAASLGLSSGRMSMTERRRMRISTPGAISISTSWSPKEVMVP